MEEVVAVASPYYTDSAFYDELAKHNIVTVIGYTDEGVPIVSVSAHGEAPIVEE